MSTVEFGPTANDKTDKLPNKVFPRPYGRGRKGSRRWNRPFLGKKTDPFSLI
jgi:hypothetical protein